ncbi:MAG: kynurenine formamidase [Phycisphaerales bacterium]|nr:MAG: kynurenine formamidase [Phycisphaerales bacterium]
MILDITPPIDAALKVWPGDTPPTREVLLDMKRGDNITLSTLHATVHLGAHVDAPSHYGRDAASIDRRGLEPYIGPAQVIRVNAARGTRIPPDALPDRLEAPRVLIATGTFPDPTNWNEDFATVSPELVDKAAALGVKLIGIDVPSMDLFHSKDLPAHQRFLAHDVAILEGIVLTDVPEGVYELIALPLRLVGFDGSPVRATLRR